MSTIAPLTLVVLTFVLPHVYAVTVEIVLRKFTLVSMVSFLEQEDAKSMHHGRLGRHRARYLSDVLPVSLIEAQLFKGRLVEYAPRPPVLVSHSHVVVGLSEVHMQLDHIKGGFPP